jgi:hypothetical protein
MKMIGALLAVCLFLILSSVAFAKSDYEEGYDYAFQNPNVGEAQCEGRSEDFKQGCLDQVLAREVMNEATAQ